ncbi:hypothetical protein BWGOE4_55940 [Bacillus mycoides]|uniref:hypothetical protein n=1 Tax=Bacillus mycoides TaxID=1405 RepID=UPI000892EB32|nr:hypothetical protein [Bacillus mycoides]OFD52870.1 hypothetical protein BWGOE4_55940 [Bacillus mycoides]OFD56118.1 hypothetical protein BWGOE7_56230 [Bacillus mycoides]OFD87197.1 hypothetical protein BWGOE12_57730 [Bacillus mycoides]
MEKKKITAAMQGAKHSMQTDGFEITEEHTKLVEKRLRNEITEEEFLKEVRKLVLTGE